MFTCSIADSRAIGLAGRLIYMGTDTRLQKKKI